MQHGQPRPSHGVAAAVGGRRSSQLSPDVFGAGDRPGSISAAGMVPPGGDDLNPAVNTLQTLLAARSRDGWRIVLFQNTPAQFHGRPELTEQHLAELRQVQRSGLTVA